MLLVLLALVALVALDCLFDFIHAVIQRVSDHRRIMAAQRHNARIWGKEIA